MSKTFNVKKLFSIILAIVMLISTFAIAVRAASYSTGNYKVATSSGVNVRSGAGTGYSVVGASSNGTSFYVSRTSGSWGYTSSIRCTNGTRSGWVCLDYCVKQGGSSSNSGRATYNDVFASVKGSGYSLSQGRSSESTTFTKGTWVYVWGWLHDANGNLYKSYGSGKCNMTLSIYRPNGTCAYSYTYNDCDNNWIGQKLDEVGTWKIQSKISGSLTGTNTRTITVKQPSSSTINPTGVSLNCSSLTLSKGSTKTLSATVYPSNATNKSVTWTSSNSSVASVSNGRITANGFGTATITARTSNGKTSTCRVTVKGVSMLPTYISSVYAGDVLYFSISSYGVSSSGKWSSSNGSIASVSSSGKVTTKKPGYVTITFKTSDGYSASKTIYVNSKTVSKTGKFNNGCIDGVTVKLNKNAGNGYIYINSYNDVLFKYKTTCQIHVLLRDGNGRYITEFDTQTGKKLKLGNDHDSYQIYVSPKKYPNTWIGNADNWNNIGGLVSYEIKCDSNCYIW